MNASKEKMIGKYGIGSKLVLVALSFLHLACSTFSYRQKVFSTMAVGAALGGAYGNQKEDYRTTHTAMYGSMGAAVGALVATTLLDPDAKADQLLEENKKLTTELNKYKMPEVIDESTSAMDRKLPKELSRVVRPGSWRRLKIDVWAPDSMDENVWYRQTERFELIPPETK